MPWWLIGLAFVSTSVSSEQIVGTIGRAYQDGMGVANWEWFSLPVYVSVLVLFIPIYLKNRVATVPELLTRRFGPLCGDLYSWTMLAAYVFVFLVPVLYGGSLALHELTGWNFLAVLWTMATVVGIYTVKGGMGSIMWTDAFQCVLLLIGGVVLFLVALTHIPGGWPAMEAAAPERFHLYRPPDDPLAPFLGLLCGALGVFLFYQSTNQVMIQRVLTARSTWDGLMGIVFAGFINLFRPMVTCFLGFVVYHWIHQLHRAPPLEDLDQTFPFALKTFAADWGLRGVVLSRVFGRGDVHDQRAGQRHCHDLLAGRLPSPGAPQSERGRVDSCRTHQRRIGPGHCLPGGPLVPRLGGIFLYFQTGVTYVATPFISVILMGILWKRTNYPAAVVGIVGGSAIVVLLASGLPAAGIHLHWLYVGFIAQVIIMLLVTVVSLATRPPEPSLWGPFLWRPSVLAFYDDGPPRPWYKQVKLWFALYATAWVAVYWRFW